MSDREGSPEAQENGSHHSEEKSPASAQGSQSPEPAHGGGGGTSGGTGGISGRDGRSPSPHSHSPCSRSRSGSYSRSYHRRNSYSRSRSRSRSGRHRHHYYSRSRSRSPKRKRYSRSHSRSYSPRHSSSPRRSYSPSGRHHSPYYGSSSGSRYYGYNDRHREYYRSHSRSPMSNRRRHVGSRVRRFEGKKTSSDNPNPSHCLGVFGLSLYTQERDLKDVFTKYGPLEDVQVVYDAQSGRSRGFAFVYFENVEDSKMAKERCNGLEIDGRKIRVDYSITHRAHTPTPGIYMGKPTYPRFAEGGNGGEGGSRGGGGGYRGRSPSPSGYYSSGRRGRRYSRSRSRSFSPQRYYY